MCIQFNEEENWIEDVRLAQIYGEAVLKAETGELKVYNIDSPEELLKMLN